MVCISLRVYRCGRIRCFNIDSGFSIRTYGTKEISGLDRRYCDAVSLGNNDSASSQGEKVAEAVHHTEATLGRRREVGSRSQDRARRAIYDDWVDCGLDPGDSSFVSVSVWLVEVSSSIGAGVSENDRAI